MNNKKYGKFVWENASKTQLYQDTIKELCEYGKITHIHFIKKLS